MRRFDREALTGFVNTLTYQQPHGVELLSQDGQITTVSYSEIKFVRFVKDFEGGRDRMDGGIFQTRPKMEGLWIRMKFRDGEVLDGVLPNNLLQIDPWGYTVTPPEPYANHQRIFVPREALESIQVIGVVGGALRRAASKRAKPDATVQPGLFE